MDYSQEDIININNQLFRRARNNMSKNTEPIKDLDSDVKDIEKKSLGIYGSELINNLNQINYTFRQLEDYIFVPSKINIKNVNKVIEEGVKAKVEDIKEPTEPIEPIEPVEAEVEDELPELVELERFSRIDRDLDYTQDEIKKNFENTQKEVKKLTDKIRKAETEGGQENFIEAAKDYKAALEDDILYLISLKIEERKKKPKPPPPPQPPEEILEPTEQLIKDGETDIDILKESLKSENFQDEDVDILRNVKDVIKFLKRYKNQTEGAGRRIYTGGVGVKGMKRKNKKVKEPLVVQENPEEFEYIEEEAPADEAKANLISAKKLDKSLVETVNVGQKSPVPAYMTKIYELMTNLIQFIGRTTVLYITRIKKNLNYLDEEQVRLIYNAISLFKSNLKILKDFKNKGGAIIKDTLYTQVEKETLGLYNEIYNSIRNYNKLKDYTIFKGAGMDRLVGGYFIQSDNPFIRDTPTKRFL
jgi:hypothetical protein